MFHFATKYWGLSIVLKLRELIFTKVSDNYSLDTSMIDDFDACILLKIGGWFDEWRTRYHIPAI